MKKLLLLSFIMVFIFLNNGCKDDEDKQFNTLKITSGEFEGFTHTFSPNLGFWSVANETTWYVHLVLGDDDKLASSGENIMSIVYYDTGASQVSFPSPEGQWIEFGINYEGLVYYFRDESATLTIDKIDETKFEGSLTGQFVDISNSSRIIGLEMDISINLEEY